MTQEGDSRPGGEALTFHEPGKEEIFLEPTYTLFLEAADAALRNETVAWDGKVSPEDWEALFRLAGAHHMLPLFCEAVRLCPDLSLASPERLESARQMTRNSVLRQTVRTAEFLALYRRLLAAGLKPLVVKGLICRRLYPHPDHRASGDEDVLIDPADFEACRSVMADFGMTPADGENKNACEVPFRKEGSPLYIELHKSLFPPDSDAYGELNDFFREAFSRADTVTESGVPVWTLAPTDHLFYLICHAFKHFLHSGFGVRQVCDMVLYANEYGSRIDWERVLENCRVIRAHRFAAALFAIGQQYLHFDPERAGYPACWREIPTEPEPLLEELVSAGIYGQADMSRLHSSNITLSAVAARKKGEKSRTGLAASLFPPAKSLEGRYPYLKKHPWLLPVAWIHRMLRHLRRNRRRDDSSAPEILRTGRRRVELLKRYGILD